MNPRRSSRSAKLAAALVVSVAGTLALASAAQAAVTYTPTEINFGKQKVGKKSQPEQVVVRGSTCPDVIGPGGFIQPGICPEPLDVAVSGNFVIVGSDCPSVLPGGLAPSQCTVSVAFKPTSRGSKKGFLRLQSTPSIVGVPLSGKGCVTKKTGGKKKTICKKKK